MPEDNTVPSVPEIQDQAIDQVKTITSQPDVLNSQAQALPVQPSTPDSKSKRTINKIALLIFSAFLLIVLVLVGVFYFIIGKPSNADLVNTNTNTNIIRIGLSLDTLKELRWSHDRDLIIKRAAQLGASVITLVANSDDEIQISQIKNLITQKVDVLIIVPHNAKVLSEVVEEARKAGIKVIAYDRMILNSNIDLYISFDSVNVGSQAARFVMKSIPSAVKVPNVAFIGGSDTDNNAFLVKQGAMGVIDPLVKSGKARLVFDQFTPNWNPDSAYKNLNTFLNTGGKVDAVIASNDGTAMGAIQALTEHNLAGKVPVSGQDAELSAVKRLISGIQTVTLYKPLRLEAYSAAENAVELAKGKTLKTETFTNNGLMNVPSILLNPIPVTKSNIDDTLIKDGFYTLKEVYESSTSR